MTTTHKNTTMNIILVDKRNDIWEVCTYDETGKQIDYDWSWVESVARTIARSIQVLYGGMIC